MENTKTSPTITRFGQKFVPNKARAVAASLALYKRQNGSVDREKTAVQKFVATLAHQCQSPLPFKNRE